jgi:hypothetical protein
MYLTFMFRAKIWKIHALMSLVFYAHDHFFPDCAKMQLLSVGGLCFNVTLLCCSRTKDVFGIYVSRQNLEIHALTSLWFGKPL